MGPLHRVHQFVMFFYRTDKTNIGSREEFSFIVSFAVNIVSTCLPWTVSREYSVDEICNFTTRCHKTWTLDLECHFKKASLSNRTVSLKRWFQKQNTILQKIIKVATTEAFVTTLMRETFLFIIVIHCGLSAAGCEHVLPL